MSTNLKCKPCDKPAPYKQPVSRPRPDQLLSAEAELMQSILDPAEEIVYGGILDV
ncbi:hypothetical protein M405DRAFT_832323 [Rhizopogon salebrosus TDB-379]|nr:hypothetical protein M405DRAFT_832323 [Rhizopogon salebrosus TDB-379]